MQEEKIRYYFVDGIRGVAIINMVIFHFLYDVYQRSIADLGTSAATIRISVQ